MNNAYKVELKDWIFRDIECEIDVKNLDYIKGKIVNVNDLFLPSSIIYLTYSNKIFYFVTYDKPKEIKFQSFWDLNDKKENSLSKLYTSEAYINNSYSSIQINGNVKILGLQSTKEFLYALALKGTSEFILFRWDVNINEGLPSGEPFSIVLEDVYTLEANFDFTICEVRDKGDYIVLNYDSGEIAYGRVIEYNPKIQMISTKKLKNSFKNKSDIVITYDKNNSKNESNIQFWGIEKNSGYLFRYLLSTNKKEQSKCIIMNIKSIPILKDVKSIAIIRVDISDINPKYELSYNEMLVFSTDTYNIIFSINNMNSKDKEITIKPLIAAKNEIKGDVPRDLIDVGIDKITHFLSINDNFMIMGNLENENLYCLLYPQFTRKESKTVVSINNKSNSHPILS